MIGKDLNAKSLPSACYRPADLQRTSRCTCTDSIDADLKVADTTGFHRMPARRRPDSPRRLEVHVLGRFLLLRDGAPIRFPQNAQRKPKELLQAIIAFGGTEVSTSALLDALWPDSEGDAAHHSFESTLYRLRKLLGEPRGLRVSEGKLSLDPERFWVDMWEFELALRPAGGACIERLEHLARARGLYKGHFLEQELEKSWALIPRQVLLNQFIRCIRDEARIHADHGRWNEAAQVYRSALESHVLVEDFYRGLMLCQRELGDHSEALQTYRSCQKFLTRFLGISPNAKTEALYQSVRQRALTEARGLRLGSRLLSAPDTASIGDSLSPS